MRRKPILSCVVTTATLLMVTPALASITEGQSFNDASCMDGCALWVMAAIIVPFVFTAAFRLLKFILRSVDSLLERHLSPRGWRRLFVIAMACGIVFFIFWLFSQGGTS